MLSRNMPPKAKSKVVLPSGEEETDEEAATGHPPDDPDDPDGDGTQGRVDAPPESVSAEQFFDRLDQPETSRLLIRGVAGSGKTTLLRWAAVQASRSHGECMEGA